MLCVILVDKGYWIWWILVLLSQIRPKNVLKNMVMSSIVFIKYEIKRVNQKQWWSFCVLPSKCSCKWLCHTVQRPQTLPSLKPIFNPLYTFNDHTITTMYVLIWNPYELTTLYLPGKRVWKLTLQKSNKFEVHTYYLGTYLQFCIIAINKYAQWLWMLKVLKLLTYLSYEKQHLQRFFWFQKSWKILKLMTNK